MSRQGSGEREPVEARGRDRVGMHGPGEGEPVEAGARDWVRWHDEYDDPASNLSRRLRVVRAQLRAHLPVADGGRLISMCAGDGRDVLPVLAEQCRRDIRALLVERDPLLTDRARVAARDLPNVAVRTGDAGIADAYLEFGPAEVALVCGVFGNISVDDARRTIAALPGLLAPGGVVIWTRGGPPSEELRRVFAAGGFTELAFAAPDDALFRVGVHRRDRPAVPVDPGTRLFTFR